MQNATLDQCSPESDYGMEVPLMWSDFQEALLSNTGKHLTSTRENVEKNKSDAAVCTPSKVMFDYIEGNPERKQNEETIDMIQPRIRLSSMLSRREAMKIRGRLGVNDTSNPTLPITKVEDDRFSACTNQASRNQSEQTDLYSNSRNFSVSLLDEFNDKERESNQRRSISRSGGGVNRRSRSYSPSRSSPKDSHFISQEEDLFHSDDQLMYGLDGNRIEKMASDIEKCCRKIADSDSHSLLNLLDQAQKRISPIGFCHSHFFLCEPGGGLSSFERDDTHLKCSPLTTKRILDDAFATGSSSNSSRNKAQFRSAEPFRYPGQVIQEDASWKDLVSLMRSCSSQIGKQHGKWTSIYIIPISADSIPSDTGICVDDSPSNDLVRGFIIAVEALPTVSIAVSKRSSYISETKVRRVMSLQWYKQIAAAVWIRLRSLREKTVPSSIDRKEGRNQIMSAAGALKFHVDMGSVTDPSQVPKMLAHAGVHLLGAPISFVLQTCTVQGNGSERSAATLCDAHTVRSDSASNPISVEVSGPRLVENRGIVTSLLSATRSIERPTQQSRNQHLQSSDSEGTSGLLQNDISATRLEVSRRELASLGLPVDKVRHGETWTLLCLQIPDHFQDRTGCNERSAQLSSHSGGSSPAGDRVVPWCYVLAAPSSSSSLSSYSSTAGVNSLRGRDHGWSIDNAEMLERSRSFAVLASEAFSRIKSHRDSAFNKNIRKLSVQLQNIADVTAESSGPRSTNDLFSIQNIQKISEIIESSKFSSIFSAEEGYFLSSGTFLSSLDSVQGPRSGPGDPSKITLIRLSSPESLQKHNVHMADVNGVWMRQLRCGMAVRVDEEGDGTSRSQESEDYWGADLFALLGDLSVGVKSALLVPLPCPVGLCVLVLVNRLPHTNTSSNGISFSSNGFSRSDAESVLNSDLYRQVVRAVTATHTAHRAHILKRQNIRLRVKSRQLGALLGTQRGSMTGHATDPDSSTNAVCSMLRFMRGGGAGDLNPLRSRTSSLSTGVAVRGEQGQDGEQEWRSDYTQQDTESAEGEIGGLLLLGRLRDCTKHFLKKHFPNDIVRFSSTREMFDMGSEPAGSKTLRSYISGASYADPGSTISTQELMESAEKVDASGDVLFVTMTRHTSDPPYTLKEEEQFETSCALLSIAVSSIRDNAQIKIAETGSTKELLLPVLTSLLPQLLSTFTDCGGDNNDSGIESALYQVAESIHELTGGAATIKMPPSSSFAPLSYTLTSNLLISSESDTMGSVHRTDARMHRKRRSLALMDERILDQSLRSIPGTRLGSAGESDVNQILLKLVALSNQAKQEEAENSDILRTNADRQGQELGKGQGQEQAQAVREVTVTVQSAQSMRGFSEEQRDATRLISLVLSHCISMRNKIKLHKIASERSSNDVRCLNVAIKGCNERIAIDNAVMKNAKLRSSSAMQLAHFSSQCCGISTMVGLGSLVAEILPQALTAKKVVLLLLREDPHSSAGTGTGIGTRDRSFFLPVLQEGLSDDQALISHTTLDQMSRIPDYSESSRSRHSRIMLVREESGVTYGALLILCAPAEGDASMVGTVQSDVKGDASRIVRSAITGCMSRLDLIDSIATSQLSVTAVEQLEREREALRVEVASLSASRGRVEAKCERLCADYESIKTVLESAQAKQESAVKRSKTLLDDFTTRKDEKLESYRISLEESESRAASEGRERAVEALAKKGMETLIQFSVSGGLLNRPESAIAWLRDFLLQSSLLGTVDGSVKVTAGSSTDSGVNRGRGTAGSTTAAGKTEGVSGYGIKGPKSAKLVSKSKFQFQSSVTQMHVISRSERGHLSGGGDIRGVLTAANEAVMTGESIERISEYSVPWILESEENEREVIVAAVALVCEVLWYSSLKPSALTIRMIGEDKRREKSNTRLLDRALLASEGVTLVDCASVEALSALVQESVRHLLEDTVTPKVDEAGAVAATAATGQCCSVRCALLFPPSPPNDTPPSLNSPPPLRFEHLRAWLAEAGLSSDFDVVCRVLSVGVSQCAVGSVFWCPIMGSIGLAGAKKGQIAGSMKSGRGLVALLRVEKVVRTGEQSLHNRTHSDSLSRTSPSLLIMEEEGELIKMFCRLIGPAVDRVEAAERASQWMDQTRRTLAALQGKNSQLEESLRSEVSRRQRSEESAEIEKTKNQIEKNRNDKKSNEDLEPDSTRKEFDTYAVGDGVMFYRKALAFLKLKNLNRDKKYRVFKGMKEELAASNDAMSFLEQRLGDYSVMIKGLNGASMGVNNGVASLWARSCPVLMGVLSSYTALKNCALCVLRDVPCGPAGDVSGDAEYRKDDGLAGSNKARAVCVLSVKELSTPLRDQYDSDCSNIASTDSSDLGCTKGLVTVQPGASLDPIVHKLLLDILSMPSQRQLLYKVVDGQVTDEEGRVHTQYNSTQCDSDSGTGRGGGRGRSGTGPSAISKGEETWLVCVRTARTVLGVLKITLKSSRKKSSSDQDESMNHSFSKISFSPGLKSEVSGEGISDRKDRSLAAQSALVTYSELIAPLLCAATLIEEEKERMGNTGEPGPHISPAAALDRSNVQAACTAGKSRPLDRFLSDCLALASRSCSRSSGYTHSGGRDSHGIGGAVPDPNLRIPLPARASGIEDNSRDGFIGSRAPRSSSSSSSSSVGLDSEEAIRRILQSISGVVECGGTCRLGVLISDLNDISPIKRREKRKENTIRIPDRRPPPRFCWFHESTRGDTSSSDQADIFSLLGAEGEASASAGAGTGAGHALEEEAAMCAESGLKSSRLFRLPQGKRTLDFPHTEFLILSYPLSNPQPQRSQSVFNSRWNDKSEDVLGVLQVVVNASEYGGDGGVEDTLDRIAEAVSASLYLIQHQSNVEQYRQQIREEKDRVTEHRDDLHGERSTWHSTTEMWKSVTESAMVLLSASVGSGAVSFAQAVRLTKQFKHVIQSEKDEIENLKVTAKGGAIQKEERTLEHRFQAISALKSILSDTRSLHVMAAGAQSITRIDKGAMEEKESLKKQLQALTSDKQKMTSKSSNLKETEREIILDENGLRLEILSRARRMVRVVCRDSLKILDPPFEISVTASTAAAEGGIAKRLISSVNPRSSSRERTGEGAPPCPKHPALLSPLHATEDTCLKILDLLSALLSASGCALLFNTHNNTQTDVTGRVAAGETVSTDTEYQAICTGTALSWYGLPPGGLGSIIVQKIPHTPQSLVDACMLSGRSIAVEDGTADPRYCAVADGGCLSETPYMAVPLKGREGVVVGVLLAVRRRGTDSYSQVMTQQAVSS